MSMVKELCNLLGFVSMVAVSIRTMSAYSGYKRPTDPFDLMWLSDSLHNFDMLSSAILSNNTKQIIFACDRLENYFLGYNSKDVTEKMSWNSFPGESFERHNIDLQEAVDIFRRIKLIAQKELLVFH